MAWTVRYRVRLSTPLNSDATELLLFIANRQVLVSSDGKKPLRESNWLTINIHDLETEDYALEFGRRIALAVLLAGGAVDVGIDAGEDRATLGFSQLIAEKCAEQGRKLMPNVHGLSVYQREGNEVFFHLDATARVTIEPTSFLDAIVLSFDANPRLEEREKLALCLIALSKMAVEPLAEAVLCISAVEYISTASPWAPGQLALLSRLRAEASDSTELSLDEAMDVAKAITATFKSIRQSIKRKMTSLGLTDAEWKSFDDMYTLRSGIFHGSITGKDKHVQLASDARTICTRIVLAAANASRQ